MDERSIPFEENLADGEHVALSELGPLQENGNEEHTPLLSFGQEHNACEKTPQQEIERENSIGNYKEMLQKKRATRMCDLMKAKWDEKLCASVTDSLKGKFVQHMGQCKQGKILFTPEESLFLLENGSIEITNESIPMSTEEAFALMLKGSLAVEKYQVYSHLSQLGFIVVPHRSQKVCLHPQSSCDPSLQLSNGKRKHLDETCDEPKSKRLTFTGIISNKESKNVDVTPESSFSEVTASNSSSAHLEIDSSRIDHMTPENNQHLNKDTYSIPPTSDEPMDSSITNTNTESSSIKEHSLSIVNGIEDNNNIPKTVTSDNPSAAESVSCPTKITDPVFADEANVTVDVDYMDVDSLSTIETDHNSEKSQSFQNDDAIPQEEIASTSHLVNHSSDHSNENESNLPITEHADIDVEYSSLDMSVSSGNKSEEELELDDSEAHFEGEITLVKVTKKETIPLAIIDLISDDDTDDIEPGDSNSTSGEEIDVFHSPGPSTSTDRHIIKKCKVPKKDISNTTPITNKSFECSVTYPDLFRKDFVCVCPPPPHLMPNMQAMAKETYILDWSKKSNNRSDPQQPARLWNSYHDLQQNQRNNFQNRFNRTRPWQRNARNSFAFSRATNAPTHPYRMFMNAPSNFPPFQNQPYNLRTAQSSYRSPESLAQTIAMAVKPAIIHSSGNTSEMMSEISRTIYTVTSAFLNQNNTRSQIPSGFDSNNVAHSSMTSHAMPNYLVMPSFQAAHHFLSQRNYGHYEQPFPCAYRSERRRQHWNEVREENNVFQAINDVFNVPDESVPEIEIFSLVIPGRWMCIKKVLKSLCITKKISLLHPGVSKEKYFSKKSQLEIAFDVYLPGTNYKKTNPGVPNQRIIVVRSSDPLPRYSEVAALQHQCNDGVSLQVAVVDNGDIQFFSFSSINLPLETPYALTFVDD